MPPAEPLMLMLQDIEETFRNAADKLGHHFDATGYTASIPNRPHRTIRDNLRSLGYEV
jgi:hypothetical protein